MIATVTLNPAFDVYCRVKALAPGTEMRMKPCGSFIGGKGINTSRALSALGAENKAFVLLGKENAEKFIALAEDEGLPLIPRFTEGAVRENITLREENGRETRLSTDFCTQSGEAEDFLLGIAESLERGSILVFSGSLPLGASKEEISEILSSLKGIKIVLDSKSLGLSETERIKPWLVKPNEEEALAFGKNEREAAQALKNAGCENVLISLGAGGAYFSGASTFGVKAPKIKPVSTVGAGDSMTAGFIYGMVKGEGELGAVRLAVAAGSAACLKNGTLPPTEKEINALLKIIADENC